MLVKDIVYYILDAVRNLSDDGIVTEDHVVFLMKKWRSLLLKKEIDKEKKEKAESLSSEFEAQEICLDLEKADMVGGMPCEYGLVLRSTEEIPAILDGTSPKVYPTDFFAGIRMVLVPKERMMYVGTNKYLRNIIYVTLGSDMHLYLRSSNPQFLYLRKVRLSAVFDDFEEAYRMSCEGTCACDVLDMEFPMRSYLVPNLVQALEQEILGVSYRPRDVRNDASDDLADLISFIRRNTKSTLQKQIEE